MRTVIVLCFACLAAVSQTLNCDMSGYRAADGLRAAAAGDSIELSWQGEHDAALRARFGVRDGRPVVRELAVGGKTLARDLTPEFEITSGRRRMSQQQIDPLKALGIALTPELVAREE